MLNYKILAVVFMVAVSCSAAVQRNYYEETWTYSRNPQCKPSNFDKGIKCSAVGPTINQKVASGMVSANFSVFNDANLRITVSHNYVLLQYEFYGLHYMPLASAYYVARFADALGYQDSCPTNKTFLKELDIISPWSGTGGSIAIGKIKYTKITMKTLWPRQSP